MDSPSTSSVSVGRRLALILAFVSQVSHADIVRDWNQEALAVIRDQALSPAYASRDLAILHTAVYNAVESVAGTYQQFSGIGYGGAGIGPSGASLEAAAAAAAYTVMADLYPSQQPHFWDVYQTQLTGISAGQAKTDGVNWGASVAADLLLWRSTDGAADAGAASYTEAGQIGYWQRTPPLYDPNPELPGWKNVKLFSAADTAAFSPPGLGISTRADYLASSGYAADYNQVQSLGSTSSGSRTLDQTNLAWYWSAAPGTVTTAGQWNEIAQTVAFDAGMTIQDSARLFAAVNVAMADAAIVAWESVYAVDFWRPVTAIPYGDSDGNGSTVGDEFWTPLLDSANLPEYPSTVSALSGAAAGVLGAIVGDSTTFTYTADINGDGIGDLTMTYNSFSEAADAAGISQIYGGVAFATSVEDGIAAGQDVGSYIMANNFGTVPEPGSAWLLAVSTLALLAGRRRRK